MFARLIFLAPGRPFWVNVTNFVFSSLFKSTMYFFAIANSFQAFGEFRLSKLFNEVVVQLVQYFRNPDLWMGCEKFPIIQAMAF
jgi:hypothetical protein